MKFRAPPYQQPRLKSLRIMELIRTLWGRKATNTPQLCLAGVSGRTILRPLILSGHAHYYERFAPQRPDGTKDSTYGIREFVVGTGGASPDNPMRTPRAANSEVDSEVPGAPGTTYYGVLKLDLHTGGYAWEFRPRAVDAFTDSGSGQCHGKPPAGA